MLRAIVASIGSAPAILFVPDRGAQYLVERGLLPEAEISGYLVIPPLFFDVAVGFGWHASAREISGRHFEGKRTQNDLMLLGAALSAALALTALAPSPLAAMLFLGIAAGRRAYLMTTIQQGAGQCSAWRCPRTATPHLPAHSKVRVSRAAS